MEKKEMSQAYLRKRKMLLVMPLLIIPFLTMGFWALSGGKVTGEGKAAPQTGLNTTLPDARLKEEKLTGKLSFYDQARKDSVKFSEWMRSDPYYPGQLKSEDAGKWKGIDPGSSPGSGQLLNPFEDSGAGTEGKILEKLARLQKGLEEPSITQGNTMETPKTEQGDSGLSREVDRLDQLMKVMKGTSADDPQMERLESVMDKILDIQHPERVRRQMEQAPENGIGAPGILNPGPSKTNVSLINTPHEKDKADNGFFGLNTEGNNERETTAIEAAVHGNQTLTDGAVVKLRLTQDIHIGEVKIPNGSFVYGKSSLSGERLRITIHAIRMGPSLLPVSLEVYDLDGMEGIYIPGALEREVAKESADRSLAGLELNAFDPTLQAKAATAGLSAAKNLLSRKARQVKVTLKAGYRLLLKDKNAKH